jgi:AraC family transcriptional regulator, arabinose operon regulatory protein
MAKKKKYIFSKQEKEALKSLKLRIENFPAKRYSIADLSVELSMNRNKLYAGIKKLCFKTIHQFIVQQRIKSAKQLLRETEMPIKAIAIECGYQNVKNFHTAFKKWTGKTPSEYQKTK